MSEHYFGKWYFSHVSNGLHVYEYNYDSFVFPRLKAIIRELQKSDSFQIVGYVGADKDIQIPSTVGSDHVVFIGESVFSCYEEKYEQLMRNGFKTTVEIQDGIQAIGESCFSFMSLLSEISIPDSVRFIGASAFIGTSIETIKLPSRLICVPSNCFQYCEHLHEVSLGDRIELIDRCAFYECRNLTEITIPTSVKAIEQMAFAYSGLQRIILPEGITKIGDHAFFECRDLQYCKIPASVEIIEDNAFSWRQNKDDPQSPMANNPNLVLQVAYGYPAHDWAKTHGYKIETYNHLVPYNQRMI